MINPFNFSRGSSPHLRVIMGYLVPFRHTFVLVNLPHSLEAAPLLTAKKNIVFRNLLRGADGAHKSFIWISLFPVQSSWFSNIFRCFDFISITKILFDFFSSINTTKSADLVFWSPFILLNISSIFSPFKISLFFMSPLKWRLQLFSLHAPTMASEKRSTIHLI